MTTDLPLYEAARRHVAGIEWKQDQRFVCYKRCSAAKAHVLVARPRGASAGRLPEAWPVLLYRDRVKAGTIEAATLAGALRLADAWITDQLVALQRKATWPDAGIS
ncbi:hypothetical protein [Ferrovibrio sp.]|uniref:hypothetical protein n=1 Tax=Ferrovibrio sp. TaxID=1917215 RepID=UPI003511627D